MKKLPSSNYFKERLLSKDFRESFEDAHFFVDVAVQLHRSRVEAGLTQQQLAELAGLKQANIARYERPGYQSYTIKILLKIVRAMGGRLTLAIKHRTPNVKSYSFESDNRHQFVDARSGPAGSKSWGHANDTTYVDQSKASIEYSGVQYV